MINRTFRFLLLSVVVSFTACSTDFDLTSEWKDITVVYGLLNHTDSAQYIRVTRAFLDEETNALQQAQIEDSVFYNSIDVRLVDVATDNAIVLQKVDGNVEGYPKDSGVFVSSPNWLYKTKETIQPGKTYRLVVTKDDGNEVKAETKVVSDYTIIKPVAAQEINILPGLNAFYGITWKNAANAAFYGLTTRFWYTEFPTNNPSDSVLKHFDWIIFTDFIPENTNANATVDYRIPGNSFYAELSKRIPKDNTVSRKPRKIDFFFAAGGKELYTYYLVGQSKLGITSGQIGPEYTNVDGGRGVLSSRLYRNVLDVPFRQATVDSIACSAVTKDLRFLNSQGLLCN